MLKRWLIIVGFVVISTTQYAQNFFISGGNAYSAMMCASGEVYTWGANSEAQLGRGTVGTDAPTPGIVNFPGGIKVKLLDAGSGGHGIVLACDNTVYTWGANCVGQLGDGSTPAGSPGSGACTHTSISPLHVVKGATPGGTGGNAAYLSNVTYVTSGTSQSYAILASGDLVAWGDNSTGQLGNGKAQSMSSSPVYVHKALNINGTGDGGLLTNVVAVDAGDYHCYALTADGTVWAWGKNDNAQCGGYTTNGGSSWTTPAEYDYAVPLYKSDGSKLNLGAKGLITAGDTHGLFMQNIDPSDPLSQYVWAIGGDWGNGQVGITTGYDNKSYVQQVSSGELQSISKYSTQSYLFGIKSIAAGQAHSLAMVDPDGDGYGYLMTWGTHDGTPDPAAMGENPLSVNTAGLAAKYKTNGTAGAADVELPVFARWTASMTDTIKNVVGISDGDHVTYLITEDQTTKVRTIWTVGSNSHGQLGDGTKTNSDYPVKVQVTGCSTGQACPSAELGPAIITKCPATGFTLNSNTIGTTYHYVWYKNGVALGTGIDTSNADPTQWTFSAVYDNPTLVVAGDGTEFAKYKVAVYDTRAIYGCSPCSPSYDVATVIAATSPVDTLYLPSPGRGAMYDFGYCAPPAPVPTTTPVPFAFASKYTGATNGGYYGTYNVYKTATGGTPIDKITVTNNNILQFNEILSNVTAVPPNWSVWLEDITMIPKTFLPKASAPVSTCGYSNSMNSGNDWTMITAYQSFSLDTLSIMAKVGYGNVSDKMDFQIIIYNDGGKNGNGDPIPGITSIFYTSPTKTYNGTTSPADAEYKIPVGALLPGSTKGTVYWISLKWTGNGNAYFGACTPTYPIKQADGMFYQNLWTDNSTYPGTGPYKLGPFFNWQISQTTSYPCGRIKLSTKAKCPPCTPILSSDNPILINASATALCPGDKPTLKATVHPSLAGASYDFLWYKGSIAPANLLQTTTYNVTSSTTATAFSDTYALIATDPGTYVLFVRDHNKPTSAACQYTASSMISANPSPTYTITGGGSYCSNAAAPTVSLNIDGTAPFTFAWSDGTTTVNKTGITANPYIITPTGTSTYSVTAIKDNFCIGTVTTSSAVVTRIQTPDLQWTATDTVYCSGNNTGVALTAKIYSTATSTGGYTYNWVNLTTVTNMGNTSSPTLATPTGTATYGLTVTDMVGATSCVQPMRTRLITMNALPTYSVAGGATYCSGATINPVTITVGNGKAPYTLSYKDGAGFSHTATVGTSANPTVSVVFSVPEKNAGTYQVTALTDNTPDACAAQITTASVVIDVKPSITITAPAQTPFCAGSIATPIALSSLFTFNPTTGTPAYTCSTAGAISTAAATFTNMAVAGTYTVSVTYTNAGCTQTQTNVVTVNKLPSITATASPTSGICIGASATLTATATNAGMSYLWNPFVAATGVVSPSASTTYVVTGTDGSGCFSTATTSVAVNALPTITATALPTILCKGSTTAVSATATGTGMTYSWNPSLPSAGGTVTPTASTTYTVTGVDVNGCKNTGSTSFIVNAPPIPTATSTLPTICIGKSTTVSASGASSYSWNPIAGLVLPTITTTYMVTGTDNFGCVGTASTTVTVNQLPTITPKATPASICIGALSTLSATAGSSTGMIYSWSPSAGPVNPTTSSTYYVTGSDGSGCTNTATVSVIVNVLPTITASALPTAVCKGKTATISATATGTGMSYSWNPTIPLTGIVTPTASSTYIVTGTDVNGCYGTGTTSVVVNTLPIPTITAAGLSTYCIDDVAQAITLNPSVTASALGTVSGTGISGSNVAGWTFNPATATTGTYTIRYDYTDGNSCYGSATTTVKVNGLPSVTWAAANPTLVCSNGTLATITVNTTPSGGTGTFTGNGLSPTTPTLGLVSASFDPTLIAVTSLSTVTLGYAYTDLNGCKTTAAASSILVNKTADVAPYSKDTMSTPVPASIIFNLTSRGYSNVKWYLDPKTTTVIASGNTYSPTIGGAYPAVSKKNTSPDSLVSGTNVNCYNFTQTVNGCESKSEKACLTVTNCPAPAPTANAVTNPCFGGSMSTLSAISNGGGNLSWFSTADTKQTPIKSNSLTYIPTVTAVGTSTFYVAEYDAVKTCYGPTTPVTIKINPLPSVTLTAAKTTVCYTDGIQTLTPSHTTGVLTIQGGKGVVSPDKFDPTLGNATKADGSYQLTLTVKDGNNCIDSAHLTMKVTYADAPGSVAQTTYLLASVKATPQIQIPNVIATPGTGSGTGIQWSTDAAFSTTGIISGANTLTYNTGVNVVTTNKPYYVRQTENGCVSDPTTVLLNIVDCPWKQPDVTGLNICENDAAILTSNVSASIPTGQLPQQPSAATAQWEWYTDVALSNKIAPATTASYTVTSTTPGTISYFVRYNNEETNSHQTCWSGASEVKETIYPKPMPTVTPDNANVCNTVATMGITLSPAASTAKSSSLTCSTPSMLSAGQFIPGASGEVSGTYTVNYTYTDVNSCTNSTSANVYVNYTAPPVPQADVSVLAMNLPAPQTVKVTATGTDLIWYSDALAQQPIAGGTGSPFDTKLDSNGITNAQPRVGTFYVTQTLNKCESKPKPINVTISKCPWPAPGVVGSVGICENDPNGLALPITAKTLETNVVAWQWYSDAATSTPITFGTGANTDVFYPGTATTQTFYVRYSKVVPTSVACWSPATAVTRTINLKPKAVIDATTKSDYCYNDGTIFLNGSDSRNLTSTGVFYVDGVLNNANSIPINTKADSSYSIKYIRLTTATATNPSCYDTAAIKIIKTHFTPTPAVTSFNYKVIGIGAAPTISVTPTVPTNKVQWYSAASALATIAGATGTVYTKTGTEPGPGLVPYFATQTDANNCTSAFAKDTIYYQACKAAKPVANKDNYMCIYEAVPTVAITRNANSASSHLFKYYVYSPNDPAVDPNTPIIDSISSTLPVFDATAHINKTIAVGNQFWIMEYDITDKCKGPAAEIIITPKKTGKPSVLATPATFCYGTTPSVTITASGMTNGSPIFYLYDNTVSPAHIADEPVGTYLSNTNPAQINGTNTMAAGTYTYYVSQYAGGCQSEKVPVKFTINPKPADPILTAASSCDSVAYSDLKATALNSNYAIAWYTNTGTTTIASGAQYTVYKPSGLTPGTTVFKATQTSTDGCTSDKASVNYTLKPEPKQPKIVPPYKSICDYDNTIPTYSVSNATGTVNWIDNGVTTALPTHTPNKPVYVPSNPSSYINKFQAFQVENGCYSDTAIATFELIARPLKPTATSPAAICEYESVKKLTAKSDGTNLVKWYTDSTMVGKPGFTLGNTYIPTSLNYPDINNSKPVARTRFYATQVTTDANACESDYSAVAIVINAKPLPPAVMVPYNIACSNYLGPQQFDAGNIQGATYLWYNGKTNAQITNTSGDGELKDNINSINEYFRPDTSKIRPSSTYKYYVKMKDAFNCVSDSTVLTLHTSRSMSMQPILLTDLTPYCLKQGESKLFEVFAQGDILSWTINGQPAGGDSSSILFTPTQKGFYNFNLIQSTEFKDPHVQYSKFCYGPNKTFTQEVRGIPVVKVHGDTTICENKLGRIPYAITPEDSAHTFTWSVTGKIVNYSSGAIGSKYKELYRQVDFTVPGIDTIRVTEDNGACKGYDSIVVRVAPHAKPNFIWETETGSLFVDFSNITEKPIITKNNVVDTVNFNYFNWYFGQENTLAVKQSDTSFESGADIVKHKFKFGYHDVSLVSVNDYCVDSATKQIFVDMKEGLFVPNSFVPENRAPELNHFRPKGFNLETYKIWIYDTWGNLLWYSDKLYNGSPAEGWDGTYQGTVLKMDSYIWKIEATFQDGSAWEGQGNTINDKKRTMGNVLLVR